MYYILISLSALMFIFFTGMFRKSYGGDMQAMLVSSAGGSFIGKILCFVFVTIALFVYVIKSSDTAVHKKKQVSAMSLFLKNSSMHLYG